MKLLFVCTGNTCRSVIAQYLCDKMIKDRRLGGWKTKSCGVAAERNFPMPPSVLRVLGERGVTDISHTPQLVGRELLRWADIVLPMTQQHLDHLVDQYPEFSAKYRLFLDYAESKKEDVADPIAQPEKAYTQCRDTIERALEAIVRNHAPGHP